MNAEADIHPDPDAQAKQLLTAGGALTPARQHALVGVVSRLLADHPDAVAAVEPRLSPSADQDDGASGAAMAGAAPPLRAPAGDGSERLRGWAVSAAQVHHAAVDAPAAADRLHDDLQEYMAAAHRLGQR